ncbi:Mu homology domain-containing protein [Catenaria anguillulae PL171]|uniref:Mu homology domain-containing protein n=1 Tax=Catenaria anguillulae PL171 TaxID=765915 RepID=A0A1Y2HRH5_9FUNG|nr:Mu homology domain-containing protein [Catenaria anguillulae PL171]
MLSAIFFFNYKGEVLISRTFRPDVKRSIADLFRIHVITAPQVRSPVTVVDNLSFYHVKHDNIYIVAAARANVNDSVKANFTLIYELLDEVMDFGFPQITDVDTLKQYVTTESVRAEGGGASAADAAKITIQATGATSWRRPDIKYRRNEVFIDVVEDVNLLMSNKGTSYPVRLDRDQGGGGASSPGVLQAADRVGKCLIICKEARRHFRLSVPPVRQVGRFDAERTISFTPPDGEFELMRYRAQEGLLLPFKIHPVVNYISQTRLEYKINLKAQFPRKFTATGVVVRIPTPPNTVAVNGIGTFANGHGRAKYVAADNCIVWKYDPAHHGTMEMDMNAEADLTATFEKKPWTRPPITMDFVVPMFTASGVQVRFLKVFEKSNYETVKWVRYHAKAGSYQFRF